MKVNTQLLTDCALIQRFKEEQCEASIKELVLRHKDRIYTHIYFILKDHYLAEDIFQESMIKAIRNIKDGKYTDKGKFGAWVSRIAHNLCIDHIRRAQASNKIQIVCQEDLQLELRQKVQYDNDFLEQAETTSLVWNLINQLPEEQMEVVVMRIYGEMSFKEISKAMGVSINTSLGRMRYALNNLRKMLEKTESTVGSNEV